MPELTLFEKHKQAQAEAATARGSISTSFYNKLKIEPHHSAGIVVTEESDGGAIYLDPDRAEWLHRQLARIFGL